MNKIVLREGDNIQISGDMLFINFIYVGNVSSIGTITSLIGDTNENIN